MADVDVNIEDTESIDINIEESSINVEISHAIALTNVVLKDNEYFAVHHDDGTLLFRVDWRGNVEWKGSQRKLP